MTADEFVALAGKHVVHVTLEENLPGIAAYGLLRPNTLAEKARAPSSALVLRDERLQLTVGNHTARLNSQGALRFGIKTAAAFLDGHTIESWSAQLDNRIFFWPEREGAAFEQSHDGHPTSKLRFDARRFFLALRPHIDLAPINTGAARRKPARRGDWIYVAAERPVDDFRLNRVKLGFKKTPDAIGEISVRADMAASLLDTLRV